MAALLAWLEPYKPLLDLILTLVIGGATIVIAVKQYRLEKIHERRELWDRRMAVYDAIYKFLSAVSRSGGPVGEVDAAAFDDATGEWRLELLFPAGTRTYVGEIRKKAHELWTTRALETSLPRGDAQVAQMAKRLAIVQWMEQERVGLKERFTAFLKLPGKDTG